MKVLQCLIADDEPIARQIIESYIKEIPYLEVVNTCKNAFEVMEFLQDNTVDLLFLDINMPKLSGISLLKTIRHKPHVIITTAYPEYAVEGFELSVTDYLLKPFSLERFLQAVLKVQQQTSPIQDTVVVEKEKSTKSVYVKSDKKIIKLDLETINYIEAYGNYIKIYTNQMILTPVTLSDFLEKLSDNFVRIHKSYVVNFNKLKLIDGNQIVLQNDSKLPISKSYRKLILNRIDGI
ncbi:DNA-binding response regulator [Aquimarina sp. AD1]|uniref:LytR/AlgR family response regulator transcription factor n=1 Tax=Aquimarina TaxID=290174 RepID=UPI00041F89E2|nr:MULTISPECIES: LytTR family DNA-binding domain-containing protein [Aquimarina]AXT55129.1 DNA-binding response regulator [Aquimarina sp. AD1]RKN24962.1 DNA-binding response regulator [Aquimarina sp. AD1]